MSAERCPQCDDTTVCGHEWHQPSDLLAQIRALPRYTVVDGKDVDLELHSDGDWLSWDDLAALLPSEDGQP